jgi:RNA polymerase sigma-70 factor, ECF subfamily
MVSSPPTDFVVAYRRFWPPIRAKCQRILGRSAIADEIAQEAFTRLWASGPSLDGTTETRTIMAWLYVTCTRLAMDALREGRVVVHSSIDEADDGNARIPSPGSAADVIAARSIIFALVKRVPADEIEAALLTRVDGLSQPEVASLLGVSERTIRRLLERFDGHSAELREEVVVG